jgi:hypothetical protein
LIGTTGAYCSGLSRFYRMKALVRRVIAAMLRLYSMGYAKILHEKEEGEARKRPPPGDAASVLRPAALNQRVDVNAAASADRRSDAATDWTPPCLRVGLNRFPRYIRAISTVVIIPCPVMLIHGRSVGFNTSTFRRADAVERRSLR